MSNKVHFQTNELFADQQWPGWKKMVMFYCSDKAKADPSVQRLYWKVTEIVITAY